MKKLILSIVLAFALAFALVVYKGGGVEVKAGVTQTVTTFVVDDDTGLTEKWNNYGGTKTIYPTFDSDGEVVHYVIVIVE